MPVIFRASGGTAGMILSWTQGHVCEHSSPCYPQMQVKCYDAKKWAYMNMIQKHHSLFWADLI